MALSLPAACTWLVVNGFAKADPKPVTSRVDGSTRLITTTPRQRYWSLYDYPEEGVSFVGISPGPGQIEGAEPHSPYSDCWLSLKVEGGAVTEALLGESWSGCPMARAKQPPSSGSEIGVLLNLSKRLLREVALGLEADKDINLVIDDFLANDPEAIELLEPAEEAEE